MIIILKNIIIKMEEKNNLCKICYDITLDNNLYCNKCKNNKHCIFKECLKNAYYNYQNEKKAIYCGSHKLDNMINIRNKKKCLIENCFKQPCYNFKGETKALYCGYHKLDTMIDIKNLRCLIENCNIRASFNYKGETKALYCSSHKQTNMINIRNKYCIECNIKYPNFNYNGEKPLYCFNCKLTDMVDTKHIKCLYLNCNIRPSYNLPNNTKSLYCNNHKLENMIIVSEKRHCNYDNCLKRPTFNYENESKALYCKTHKLENMVDILNKRCITPLCDKIQQLDNYCFRCFYALYPNDNRCKRIKIKENEVKKFIENEFKDLDIIYDQPIKGDGLCFNIRPDILIHLNNHSVIIEIDENQHKFYDPICDNSRTHKIQEALNRPIIIIRFNPDGYNKIPSPFKLDKKMGLTTIPKDREEEWNNRLLLLKNTILENIEYKNEEPIKIFKLFYDDLL